MLIGEKDKLRYAAGSLDNGVVRERGIVEKVVSLSGLLLSSFVVLSLSDLLLLITLSAVFSAVPFTIAFCSGSSFSFSSSFWASSGIAEAGRVER